MKIAIGGVIHEADGKSVILVFDSSEELKQTAKLLSDLHASHLPGPRPIGISWPADMSIAVRRYVLNKVKDELKETEQK